MAARTLGTAALAAALVCAWGCKDKGGGDEAHTTAEPAGDGRLVVSLTVDWEGAYLQPAGLDALHALRAELPGVPITHFLSAAYFSKAEPVLGAEQELPGALARGDEAGLHLHPWFSLVESAGVTPRAEPTYLGSAPSAFPDGDRGLEVDLAAYSTEELRQIVRRSRQLLAEAGIKADVSFRAGGYSASPDVFEAVRAEGYLVDSSVSHPGWYEEGEGGFYEHMKARWKDIEKLEQPYFVDTPAGRILEMPNTGSFVEYASKEEMQQHMKEALTLLAEHPERDVFVNIGFHQETAHEATEQIEAVLAPLLEDRRVVFSTVADAAERARAQMSEQK